MRAPQANRIPYNRYRQPPAREPDAAREAILCGPRARYQIDSKYGPIFKYLNYTGVGLYLDFCSIEIDYLHFFCWDLAPLDPGWPWQAGSKPVSYMTYEVARDVKHKQTNQG